MITAEIKQQMKNASSIVQSVKWMEQRQVHDPDDYCRPSGLVYKGENLCVYSTGGKPFKGLEYWIEDFYGNGMHHPKLDVEMRVALAIAKAFDFYTQEDFRRLCWSSDFISKMVKHLRKLNGDDRALLFPALRFIRENNQT